MCELRREICGIIRECIRLDVAPTRYDRQDEGAVEAQTSVRLLFTDPCTREEVTLGPPAEIVTRIPIRHVKE
jgi:hypothetical protein